MRDSAGNSATDDIKVSILPRPCDGDFNCDGDVDGSDLAVFANDVYGSNLAVFAADFGRTDCPPCTQACCLPDGDCTDVLPDVCVEKYGGIPQGPGTNCDNDQCPQPREACCLPDGDCVDVPPDVCVEEYLEEPQGAGTDCETVRCLQ